MCVYAWVPCEHCEHCEPTHTHHPRAPHYKPHAHTHFVRHVRVQHHVEQREQGGGHLGGVAAAQLVVEQQEDGVQAARAAEPARRAVPVLLVP